MVLLDLFKPGLEKIIYGFKIHDFQYILTMKTNHFQPLFSCDNKRKNKSFLFLIEATNESLKLQIILLCFLDLQPQ